MSILWQEALEELEGFISINDTISINKEEISIPENLRKHFYELFNKVRKAYIEERYPDILNKSVMLSESYALAESNLLNTTPYERKSAFSFFINIFRTLFNRNITQNQTGQFEEIILDKKLDNYLRHPYQSLESMLFDPLFSLLKRKTGFKEFEEQTEKEVNLYFSSVFKAGYEKWVTLNIINNLGFDQAFESITRRVPTKELCKRDLQQMESSEAPPDMRSTKKIVIEHGHISSLLAPNIIVRSQRNGKYVGIMAGFHKAIVKSSARNNNTEWLDLKSIPITSLRGVILIYVSDSPEDISFIADKETILRPDMLLEIKPRKDAFEEGDIGMIKRRHHSLKPRLGTFIIYFEPSPSEELEQQEAGIHTLSVGFDKSKLIPAIDALVQA